MTPPRWRLILNGKSAGDDALRDAVTMMRERGIALDVRVTWEAGDAERLVGEAIADGVDNIVAAGGDGTLSEVATALAHREESAAALPALGLVPLGTANDFAAAAGIPDDALAALELVHARAPRARLASGSPPPKMARVATRTLARLDSSRPGSTWWCVTAVGR